MNSARRDTYTVLTIFRSLPPLAKQYILRMLCVDALPETTVGIKDKWIDE